MIKLESISGKVQNCSASAPDLVNSVSSLADGRAIHASRLEISVWSEYFHKMLSDLGKEEIKVEEADPEVLESLIRAIYEREVICSHLER